MSKILIRRIVSHPRLVSGKNGLKQLKAGSSAGICHKNHMDPEIRNNKPAPWPYETKAFTQIDQALLRRDRTVERFDENTKIIVVEGGLAAGKGEFGKALAHELGMRFYPEPTLDDFYPRLDGFDLRTLNWMLPEAAQYVDVKTAYINPHHQGLTGLAWNMYLMRFYQYWEALVHLFNTGEGVVIERSIWSNHVFLDAMWKHGFGCIDKPARDRLTRQKRESMWELMRPHVVIYLDVPPSVQLERVKKRNIKWEVNSEMTNLDYITTIDDLYKEEVLPFLAEHAEILMYDWTEPGDIDLIVEDLEKLDFDQYEARGTKMEDWRFYWDTDFDLKRRMYTSHRYEVIQYLDPETWDVPSLQMTDEEAHHRQKVMKHHVSY